MTIYNTVSILLGDMLFSALKWKPRVATKQLLPSAPTTASTSAVVTRSAAMQKYRSAVLSKLDRYLLTRDREGGPGSQDLDQQASPQYPTGMLLEATPRGNVLCYFDATEFAFAYYSDTACPTALLNLVALKFCIAHACLDLFLDERGEVVGVPIFVSPLIAVIRSREAGGGQVPTLGQRPRKSDPAAPNNANDTIQNKFIRMGKLSNWNPLLSPPLRIPPGSASTAPPTTTTSGTDNSSFFDFMFADVKNMMAADDPHESESESGDDDDDDDEEGSRSPPAPTKCTGDNRLRPDDAPTTTRGAYAEFKRQRLQECAVIN